MNSRSRLQPASWGSLLGTSLFLVGAPDAWTIAELSDGVEIDGVSEPEELPEGKIGTRRHVVIAFFRNADEVDRGVEVVAARIIPDGALWAAWLRRAGGHASDITDHTIREAGLARGLVDNKVAAIDEDWSGLRLVWRLERRTASPTREPRSPR